MSLYLVTFEVVMVVEAPDFAAAEGLAREKGPDAVGVGGSELGHVCTERLSSIEDVPVGWRGAIPYGASDDRTTREILSGEASR